MSGISSLYVQEFQAYLSAINQNYSIYLRKTMEAAAKYSKNEAIPEIQAEEHKMFLDALKDVSIQLFLRYKALASKVKVSPQDLDKTTKLRDYLVNQPVPSYVAIEDFIICMNTFYIEKLAVELLSSDSDKVAGLTGARNVKP